ncbi:MAG: hypothetical protein ACKPB7_29935, partial [Sphaerospermopsis kisseleviana]
VVNEVIKLTPHNPLGNQKAARSATLNFTPGTEDSFREKIRQITGYIQYQLTLAIQQNPNSKSMDRFEFIQNLLTDLQTFQTDRKPTKLDLSYEFLPSKNLQKQRLTVKKDDKAKQKQLLKAHKVKISVDKPKDFYTALLTGLNNFIDINFSSSSDREEIGFILENLKQNTKSDIYQLQNLVNQETLGKLKKLSQIKYLEFLLENIDEKASSKNYQAKIYLQDLIRRLQILEDYINNPNKADGEYEVSYAQEKFNLQTVFSRGDAYDKLPIIPLVEGYLGESEHQHQEKIEFTFGLKFKVAERAAFWFPNGL